MPRNILIILLGMLSFGFAGGASEPVIIELIGKRENPFTNAFYNGIPTTMYFLAAPLAGKLTERLGGRSSLIVGSIVVNSALLSFALFYHSSSGLFLTNFLVIIGAAFLRVGGDTVINQSSQEVRGLAQPLFSLCNRVGALLGRWSLELSKLITALQALRKTYPFAPFLISGAAFVICSTVALIFLWKTQPIIRNLSNTSKDLSSNLDIRVFQFLAVVPVPSQVAIIMSRFLQSSVSFSAIIFFTKNYEAFLIFQSLGICIMAIILAIASRIYSVRLSQFLRIETVILLLAIAILAYFVLIAVPSSNSRLLSIAFLTLGAISTALEVFGKLFYANYYDRQPEMQPQASAAANIFNNFGAQAGYLIPGFCLTYFPNYTWSVCLGITVIALSLGIFHRFQSVN